jgi:hypothetical protein
MQDGPLSGTFTFCPSAAQVQAGGVYAFDLVATDKHGQGAEKRYLVVLGAKP